MNLYRKTVLLFSILALACVLRCDGVDAPDGAQPTGTSETSADTNSPVVADGLPELYCNLKDSPLAENMINPVHLEGHNSLMPFPTDILAYRDTSSSTGVRLKITNENLPPQLNLLPEAIQMKALYKNPDGSDVDGFSATSHVLFEFDRDVDPSWIRNEDDYIARDGGDIFCLLDLTTGEYLPSLVMESHFAKDRNMISQDHVMQVMPRSRFEYGRRYMAFVTKKFKDKNGEDFSCPQNFLKAKSADGSDISNFYEPYLNYLEKNKGISRDQIVAATIFTIRSRETTITPLTDMFRTILKDDFNDDNVKIICNINVSAIIPAFSRIIYGKMLYRSFLDENGVLKYSQGFTGQRNADDKKNWVPFLFFIPSEDMPRPYPVNIAGSGIGMPKELMALFAIYNAQIGVATITIDWPYHGTRGNAAGITIYDLIGWLPGSIQTDAALMPRLLSLFPQVSLDSMSTYRAVKTYFAHSDKKGLKDLDTDNVSYVGVSLGSLCGASSTACMPGLKGAFMHVASVNFNTVLSCGTFLENVVGVSMPDGVTGAWFALVMDAIAAQQADLFDGVHFADSFRSGMPEMKTGPRPLAGTIASNDGWVTAEGGAALEDAVGLSIVSSQDEPQDFQDLLDNFIGKKVMNTFGPYDDYGLVELAMISSDWDVNQIMDQNKVWKFLESITGYNLYDVAGTLEHLLGGASGAAAYYQMDWMHGVQIDQ